MFARFLEFNLKLERKEELLKMVKKDILPLLKKEPGFVEILPFYLEVKPEKVQLIGLWHTKQDVERYERVTFPKIKELLTPYLTTPINIETWVMETTLCEHFVEAMAA